MAGSTAGRGWRGLQLDSPWTLFYGLLVLAGVTNYLPTRYGPAACAVGAGLVLEYLGLTRTDWSDLAALPIWLAVAWTLPCEWLACGLARRSGRPPGRTTWSGSGSGSATTGAWSGPSDPGTIQPVRRVGRWPIRLTWFGLVPALSLVRREPTIHPPPAAEATLRGLLRRFVAPERIDACSLGSDAETCHPEQPAR